MKQGVISLTCSVCLALLAALAGGCTRIGIDGEAPYNGDVPEGYARVEVKFQVKGAPAFETRADADPFDRIDNVNLFWFEDADGDGTIEDGDLLTERRYFDYGVRQEIFLRRGAKYYVYAIANLEDGQCPNGDLATYFDDVHTYGDLKKKYILNTDKPTSERTKIPMAATEITTLTLPGYDGTLQSDAMFSPEVTLERIFARFIINIYNRVDADGNVISDVNPVSMNGVDFIRGSYVLPRTSPGGDFSAETTGYSGDTYYQPRSVSLVPTGEEVITEYWSQPGKQYTKQTFEIYTFENRKGSNHNIWDYAGSTTATNDLNVYGRYALAPPHATHLRISSLISQTANDPENRGKVMYTWVHAGKGRNVEQKQDTPLDDITNFDVDRNTIYHINVIINGINHVEIDTRREYLDRMILLELPTAANQIDAHYVDMPAYISSNAKGLAKIQSGTGMIDAAGNVTNWEPMSNDDDDEKRWLRFSMYDPAHLVGGVPVTWYTPSASTVLWVDLPETGLSKRRMLLHFNENVAYGEGAVPATTTNLTQNPPSRTALIRVGFVDGVHTEAEYNAKVAEMASNESVFYQQVQQYGLKTIGAVGGYKEGEGYTQLLGVESVEESQVMYYTASGIVGALPYDSPNQLFWQYRTGTAGNTNQAYDGLRATRDIYNDYRGNETPPQRGQANKAPAAGAYNPFTNTNAADYCMRKNRDENGDGVITGDEVKWYLPTPVQMSQLFQWRGAFLYPLNQGYLPLWSATATNDYWTCNEAAAADGLVSRINSGTNMVVAEVKTARNAVRCVRDVDGPTKKMFYIADNGQLVADLREHLPNLNDRRHTLADNALRESNTIAPVFIISKHYVRASAGIATPPVTVDFKNNHCKDNYSETVAGNSIGTWQVPSERELSMIYAYSEVLNGLFKAEYQNPPAYPGSNATFHYIRPDGRHWGFTYVGSNNAYWYIDFATGFSYQQDKQLSNAYMRCVRYIDPSGPIPLQSNLTPEP